MSGFGMMAVGAGSVAVFAQVATASASGDPMQALWSLVGSSPVAGVMYLWVRSAEKRAEAAERNERLVMDKLVSFIETDAEWKGAVRQPLNQALGGSR